MKCILDANVPAKASYILSDCKPEELDMVNACIEFIHDFINTPDSKVVLDMDWEIISEYERNILETDMGKQFKKWLYTYISRMDVVNDMIKLETENGRYCAFPDDAALQEFDSSDRKFIALALSHCETPPIIQAADGKWLGFTEKLSEYGIQIEYLDMSYVISKYDKKIRNKKKRQ